jgi:uncharacterized protein (DUF608 family)
MNRRGFVKGSLMGLAAQTVMGRTVRRTLAAIGQSGGARPVAPASGTADPGRQLFPLKVRGREPISFRAAGFTQPACGVIYRREDEVLNGMPLGGVSTGYLDVEKDGTFGLSTLFNSGVPVTPAVRLPFLGLSVDGRTWELTLGETVGTGNAKEIHYWGHYPVVDMEYETTAPVSVGLRAWTPFIPGDVRASNIPGAVFEVRLQNTSSVARKGTLAFSFPGPTQAEAQISPQSPRQTERVDFFPVNRPIERGVIAAHRAEISNGPFRGLSVSAETGNGYALGTIGEEKARFGGILGRDGYDYSSGHQWAAIQGGLPPVLETDFGTSLAVDFSLNPGESKTVRIVLAWYSPIWKGEGTHYFRRMYTKQFADAVAVASALAQDHESLLKRILAWQQVVYSEATLPVWLRESLVNILHLITKTGYWAQAGPPIGEWCRAEDGLFGMNECPRECPQMECIPCSFYGNVPVVYFFPELALSTLRGYKGYQYPDGAAPWIFGGCTGGAADGYHETDGTEMATPSPGYQTTLNGACYADMLDRYWQCTGDDEVLKEFYPSVKKNTIYTINLRSGPDAVASVPEGDRNPTRPNSEPGTMLEWFEGNNWFGMTPHVGGIHMAEIRIVQRMAARMGDQEFVEQCDKWLKAGSDSIENKLWTGNYYLAYSEPGTGKKSDLVFGFQLDGDWMCFYHGLPGVFREDRARTTLDTIQHTCMGIAPHGAANFANPNGTVADKKKFMTQGWGTDYGAYGYFLPEVFMLAATYMYHNKSEVGMKLAENSMSGIVKFGYTWTQPNLVNGADGKRMYGSDYYQNMVLWSLPAAVERINLKQASAPSSLVSRVIQAGRKV